jgi:adenylate cyclase class 2
LAEESSQVAIQYIILSKTRRYAAVIHFHQVKEIEIKFRVADLRALTRKLRAAGFRLVTPRTHELNTLYDLTGGVLRTRGELLRLRKYGADWVLTHKSKGTAGRHKSRVEIETRVVDGKKMDAILRALGYAPSFRYEKFRAEWTDGKGHVVVDETPVGNFGEIEGAPRWIDATAKKLGLTEKDYILTNYAGLFLEWKARTKSTAEEMTFKAVRATDTAGRRSRLERARFAGLDGRGGRP